MVVVFGRKACPACRLTEKQLSRRGIPFTKRDLDTEPELVAELKERGFTSLPVVQTGDDWWAGYRPDRIAALTPATAPAPFQSDHMTHPVERDQAVAVAR